MLNLLTEEEVAKHLHVSVAALRRLEGGGPEFLTLRVPNRLWPSPSNLGVSLGDSRAKLPAIGGNMQNANDFDRSVQALLAMIGGEAVIGSSFGNEGPHSPNPVPTRRNKHNGDRDHRNHSCG